jgi:pyruvate/2-oxoacid:ferredoxin oxidoreductase alpha subunit
MTTVNYTNYNQDLTVRVFDRFYDYDVNVPADEYDIVYSYFLTQMKTKQAAGNFTVSLFRVAEETKIPALTLLQQFTGETGINLDVSLAYYLNQIRSKATLLGVSTPVTPNFYAARNVVQ